MIKRTITFCDTDCQQRVSVTVRADTQAKLQGFTQKVLDYYGPHPYVFMSTNDDKAAPMVAEYEPTFGKHEELMELPEGYQEVEPSLAWVLGHKRQKRRAS